MTNTAIFDAVRSGDLDAIGRAPRASLGAQEPDTGMTPLMIAVEAADVEVVEHLLARGADVNGQGSTGETALHVAAREDLPVLAALLSQREARLGVADRSGLTASAVAAQAGALRVLRELEARAAGTLSGWADTIRRAASDRDAIERFLAGAADRKRHRAAAEYFDLSGIIKQANQKRDKLDPAARAREEASAPELAALPVIEAPTPTTDYHDLHIAIAEAMLPLGLDELEEELHHHAEMLASGGDAWLGDWDRWHRDHVGFGCYIGPTGGAGSRLKLMARDLRQLIMAGLDLRTAMLPGLLADGVDFSGSDLSSALLVRCQLSGAHFQDARLVRTDLSQSNLEGADFRGADLTLADFEDCNLRGADFRGATLRGTRFTDADLAGARR